MRSTLRITALILILLMMLVPLVAYAGTPTPGPGPCPDDPELSKECNQEAPPFYVVINRSFEDLSRAGTGCQPIILKHPECQACCGEECAAASNEVETKVCPELAKKVAWAGVAQTEIVYEMCCDCKADPEGLWAFRIRLLHEDGTCPIDEENPDCYPGLPPGTGVDLPTPVIVGGLAAIGLGLVAVGVGVRRRTVKPA